MSRVNYTPPIGAQPHTCRGCGGWPAPYLRRDGIYTFHYCGSCLSLKDDSDA